MAQVVVICVGHKASKLQKDGLCVSKGGAHEEQMKNCLNIPGQVGNQGTLSRHRDPLRA